MFNPKSFTLTMEQAFQLRALDADIDRLSAEQGQAMVRDLLRQLAIKDNLLRDLLRRSQL